MYMVMIVVNEFNTFAVLCAYLGGDVKRLRTSVLIGSIVPLVTILVWNAIALHLSQQVDQVVDPVQLLMRYSNPASLSCIIRVESGLST